MVTRACDSAFWVHFRTALPFTRVRGEASVSCVNSIISGLPFLWWFPFLSDLRLMEETPAQVQVDAPPQPLNLNIDLLLSSRHRASSEWIQIVSKRYHATLSDTKYRNPSAPAKTLMSIRTAQKFRTNAMARPGQIETRVSFLESRNGTCRAHGIALAVWSLKQRNEKNLAN